MPRPYGHAHDYSAFDCLECFVGELHPAGLVFEFTSEAFENRHPLFHFGQGVVPEGEETIRTSADPLDALDVGLERLDFGADGIGLVADTGGSLE